MWKTAAPVFVAALTAVACAGARPGPESVAEQELREQTVTGGYVMTHEHPTAGMAFGGNYAYADALSNYQNGIPEDAYGACGGCAPLTSCDHAEVKGNFIGPQLGRDMGD